MIVNLDQFQTELQVLARAIQRGELTRAELLNLKVDVAWVQVQVREALERHLHPEEPQPMLRHQMRGDNA